MKVRVVARCHHEVWFNIELTTNSDKHPIIGKLTGDLALCNEVPNSNKQIHHLMIWESTNDTKLQLTHAQQLNNSAVFLVSESITSGANRQLTR